MRDRRYSVRILWLGLAVVFAVAGCAGPRRDRAGNGNGASAPAVVSDSRAVVQEYLEAATKADGTRMYALIATSERDDESPDSLRDTAADRYRPDTTWYIEKVDEQASTSTVVVRLNGVKNVDPNPYRFTLTKEGGEWRIVQSPELHETKGGLRIEIK
jgi:hypothetical protein